MRSEAAKREQLRVTKRRATILLAVVAVAFVALTICTGGHGWSGYAQAASEAGLVGGLADWFAVTALFRHPLGIPIPHTAIVVERKEQFGRTLGDFVQESFLTPDTIVERVRTADVVPRAVAWIVEPEHAQRVAGYVADSAVALVDALRDDDVHRTMEQLVRDRLDDVELAPVAGRALALLTRDGRHHETLDSTFASLDRYLDEHREELRLRLGQQSPWWLPRAAEDRIFERLLDGARALLQEMAVDRGHHLRAEIDLRIEKLIADLQTSPDMRARGERLKKELLEHDQLNAWVASLWADVKQQLRTQAAEPDSELRRRLAGAIVATGHRLETDPALADRVESGVESLVRYVAEHFHGEIASLVSSTIARWDSEETSRRLELLLGPDLQYIRINGTVVGGLAGVGLHALTQLLGH
jgi:uncharacterized membrane-anchored protein YjiN (DUF445 family)